MPSRSPALAAPSRWIWDPRRDLAFFILPPLFIIPLILALEHQVDVSKLGLLVLGIGGFGHHLPGFIRAYSDRELFDRYKVRLILVPALLILVCGYCAYRNLHAVTFAVAMWGTWHGAMQVNGFLRIYDAKVKSFAPWTARLDWMMCMFWFAWVILHSPMREFSLLSHFYVSGGPLIPPSALSAFRLAWDAATATVTVAFIANMAVQWLRGTPPSPLKLLTILVSVGFFWYCMTLTSSLLVGVVMWEILHDVQYSALIWQIQRQRVRSGAVTSRLERAMFGPGMGRLAFYLLLIGAYGYIGVATSYLDIHFPEKLVEGESSSRWMLQVIAVSALLHFYFDGFIWRIRNRNVREDLGLNARGSSGTPKIERSGAAKHAAKWALFVLPVGALAFAQVRGLAPDSKSMMRNLAEAVPDNWTARFLAATQYKLEGDYDKAALEFQAAVRANPSFDMAHMLLADVMFHKDSLSRALEHYRIAVELEPRNVEARANLAYLEVFTGRPDLAVGDYQAALEADPGNVAYAMGYATALMKTGRLQEAEGPLQAVLDGDHRHVEALNYLGMIRHAQGRLSEARDLYTRALAADSTHAGALENLAALQSIQNAADSVAGVFRQ